MKMANSRFDFGKIAVVGNSGVGKTAVIRSFLSSGSNFPRIYDMTFGVLAYTHNIQLTDELPENSVELLLYDTTGYGLHLYTDISKYWNEPDMLLLIYDITSMASFEDMKQWLQLTKNIKWSSNFDSPLASAIFANKTDLSERRIVTEEMGHEFAKKHNLQYFEGSAKTNETIAVLFQWLGTKWVTERSYK